MSECYARIQATCVIVRVRARITEKPLARAALAGSRGNAQGRRSPMNHGSLLKPATGLLSALLLAGAFSCSSKPRSQRVVVLSDAGSAGSAGASGSATGTSGSGPGGTGPILGTDAGVS